MTGEEALFAAAKRVAQIKHDIASFDGDRRGHYAALDDAMEELERAALAAFPSDAKPAQ